MDEILALLKSPAWWFSSVAVALLVSVLANLLFYLWSSLSQAKVQKLDNSALKTTVSLVAYVHTAFLLIFTLSGVMMLESKGDHQTGLYVAMIATAVLVSTLLIAFARRSTIWTVILILSFVAAFGNETRENWNEGTLTLEAVTAGYFGFSIMTAGVVFAVALCFWAFMRIKNVMVRAFAN